MIDAANRGETEAKRLQKELKKAQDSLKKIENAYNEYPSAKEKQERDLEKNIQDLDNEFKKIIKNISDTKDEAIYNTYRKLVDEKLITEKSEDLYSQKEVPEEESNIFKYHNSRKSAIRNCFDQFKNNKKIDKMKRVLTILKESL